MRQYDWSETVRFPEIYGVHSKDDREPDAVRQSLVEVITHLYRDAEEYR